MPTSWPCWLSVVGSWVCQKTFSRSSNLISLRVVGDLDDLGVAGAAGADLFVGGFVDGAVAVAGDDGLHAFESLEDGFAAPEAAFAEGGGFGFRAAERSSAGWRMFFCSVELSAAMAVVSRMGVRWQPSASSATVRQVSERSAVILASRSRQFGPANSL